MADITRSSFSLYKRNVGNKTVWYARFWDDELQAYGSALSTGQTTKAAASRTAQKWLVDGMPQKKSKSGETSRNRILLAISKYLRENNLVMEDEQLEPSLNKIDFLPQQIGFSLIAVDRELWVVRGW